MPEDPKHASLQALLQDRKSSTPKGRASRRLAVCLSTDLSMDFEDAEQELAAANQAVAEAEATADVRAGGRVAIDAELTKRVKAAEKAVADTEAAVDAASVVITFTALKAADYDVVHKEHPPREGNERDAAFDYNESTFPDALMLKSASKRVEDADGNLIDMDVVELIDTMSNGERTLACRVALDVNLRQSSFSEAKSLSRQRSGSNSKRR
jgi:hypothetical protein